MASEGKGASSLSIFHPEHPWIVVRKAEIDASKAVEAGNSSATWEEYLPTKETTAPNEIVKQNRNFSIAWQVGGATTLAGAAYFEFFTWLMLGTAILFVFVAYLYKPKTYIQDESVQ
jgi:hypothetical protein